ncbi:MAG TPA: type II secretion system protein [Chthonomonadaceae bacterium]|nr:type II secretion system protein [Chthonomonadaceae bacterium]
MLPRRRSGLSTGRSRLAPRRTARRGFSLIELLTMIAILVILLAVLSPVLSEARKQVQGYVCLSNMRQIGMAATLYMQDADEQYACVHSDINGWLPDIHAPYLKQWRVWICPSDKDARIWDGEWQSESFYRRTSYLSNAYVFQGDPGDWQRSISSPSIPYPSTLVVWAEAYANPGWLREGAPLSTPYPGEAVLHNAYGDSYNAALNDPTAAPCPIHHDFHLDTIHHGGGNYTFADGHARWLLPSAFTTAAIVANGDQPVDDRTDPFVTNGARSLALSGAAQCVVFCCPKDIGTPPSDGERPWFRP